MNEIQIFNNPTFGDIRTVEQDGEPWFVGKDVAEVLGYSVARKAIYDHVDAEDKGAFQIGTPSGEQSMTIINESGLYSLILSSKLPNAKQFKHWVTSEVLPSIRRHGMYATEATVEQMIADPDVAIKLLEKIKEERQERKRLEVQAEADRPKVLFADAVAASESSILVGDLAKIIRQNGVDMGEKRLFRFLRENGYLCSKGERYNLPTQRSMERGWFRIKETTINNPDGSIRITKTVKVTGKGQRYFINLFLNK